MTKFIKAENIIALYFIENENKDSVSLSELSNYRISVSKRIPKGNVVQFSNVYVDNVMANYKDCFEYGLSKNSIILRTTRNNLIRQIIAYIPNEILRKIFGS